MSKLGFDKALKNIQRVQRELPKVIANDTKNYFLNTWREQGHEGDPWEEPKRWQKKNPTRRDKSAILVQSGALRRAVANSLKVATWEKIYFDVTDVKYAGYNNYGTEYIPPRPFMVHSFKLQKKQLDKIQSYFKKVWT